VKPFTSTISFADALRLVLECAVPIARVERVTLNAADDRVAAADIAVPQDVPPFDRSAMDGYAVRSQDTSRATASNPVTLTCIDFVHTGLVAETAVGPGHCIEIATGAPLPEGADAVVMVEETTRDGDQVHIRKPAAPGQNIGRRGGDLARGQPAVRAGDLLGPGRLGVLAACGVKELMVYARPSVALVSTGNEIVEPGRALRPGQIYDVNRFTLAALVHRHGATATSMPVIADAVDHVAAALEGARDHDVIVCSGGSSVGDRDLVVDTLRERGQVIFHGISVKPGKPTALGRIHGTPVFAMPGNPTSCLSNGYLLLLPFLRRTARLPAWQPRVIDLPLGMRIASASDRHQFYTVRLNGGVVEPAFTSSSHITSMADADGYIEIPAGTATIDAGTLVRVTLFT
jgi:molybdenum cofactor synthesis domain-containing protein